MLFTKPKKAIGVDIGAHSVKAVQMSRAGGRLRVDGVGYALVDRNLVNMDPIAAHANVAREALTGMPLSQCLLVGALPGQTVVIRYPRLPETARDRIGAAIEKEAGQQIPYDLSEVFLDWALLDTVTEGSARLMKMLLVAAKHEVIESRVQIAAAAEIQYGMLSVDSLALADAAEGCGFLEVGKTVALVNIGLTSASIHFVKDGISNFIRDINWGARELIQTIVRAQKCEYSHAEKMLCDMGTEKDKNPAAEPNPLDLEPEPESAAAKPASGGGSLLDPFEDELDITPSAGRGSNAPPAGSAGADAAGKDLTDLLAAPLSRLVSEIRRSFDYYEHELYETPVDRIVLSGGVAHLPLLRDTLGEELGVKAVDVANPLASALVFRKDLDLTALEERPAQFMVAIGLASRGMADL